MSDKKSDKKFIISSKQYRGETVVMSVRLPNDMIAELDRIAEQTGRNRNEVIQKCLAFAINNLEIK
jgi:metal-responsive CopG/Arc/MetJ family transcriptional regulator